MSVALLGAPRRRHAAAGTLEPLHEDGYAGGPKDRYQSFRGAPVVTSGRPSGSRPDGWFGMTSGIPSYPRDGSVEFQSRHVPVLEELPASAAGAVIIPVHDESAVIARTLRSLAPLSAVDGIEVIVVCNGCTDNTADIARRFAGVRVVEIPERSKTAALNAGDEAATTWPRLYLDGDIEIDPHSVLAVFGALGQAGVLAARARYVYDATDASIPVRAYHRARSRIPAPPTRLWGAGGYATNEAGHRRFGRFPDVIADDSWFDQQFDDSEKQVVPSMPMRVRTPEKLAELVAVLSRRRRGYLELDAVPEGSARGRAVLASARGPRTAFDAFWYVLITLAARWRAARMIRRGTRGWERDASSRKKSGDR